MYSAYEQEQKLLADQLVKEKEKESIKLQKNEILKQNELQLKVKNDRKKEYKEQDFVESKKVFAFNIYVCVLRNNYKIWSIIYVLCM
jgi:hypothetical protein